MDTNKEQMPKGLSPEHEELWRRQQDCPKGVPLRQWVQMTRRERRAAVKGRRK